MFFLNASYLSAVAMLYYFLRLNFFYQWGSTTLYYVILTYLITFFSIRESNPLWVSRQALQIIRLIISTCILFRKIMFKDRDSMDNHTHHRRDDNLCIIFCQKTRTNLNLLEAARKYKHAYNIRTMPSCSYVIQVHTMTLVQRKNNTPHREMRGSTTSLNRWNGNWRRMGKQRFRQRIVRY
jgi:hypothetical protein